MIPVTDGGARAPSEGIARNEGFFGAVGRASQLRVCAAATASSAVLERAALTSVRHRAVPPPRILLRVILTISTTYEPATDSAIFSQTRIAIRPLRYSAVSPTFSIPKPRRNDAPRRSSIEVDPIGLVRRRGRGARTPSGGGIDQYVNDRPVCGHVPPSVALGKSSPRRALEVCRTPGAGRERNAPRGHHLGVAVDGGTNSSPASSSRSATSWRRPGNRSTPRSLRGATRATTPSV